MIKKIIKSPIVWCAIVFGLISSFLTPAKYWFPDTQKMVYVSYWDIIGASLFMAFIGAIFGLYIYVLYLLIRYLRIKIKSEGK